MISSATRKPRLAVLKKYNRNDDREILEDSYNNYVNKYLPLPIATADGIKTILAELGSTMPQPKTPIPSSSWRIKSRERSRRAGL